MTLTFSSPQDKITFLKSVPTGLDYGFMLKQDFGFTPPVNATEMQKEQYWKFLIANDRPPASLVEVEKFYFDLHYTPAIEKKARKEKYVPKHKNGGFKPGMEGKLSFKHEADGMWYAYIGDTMVARSRSQKYITQRFEKYGHAL